MKKSIVKPFLILLLLAGCHPQDDPAPNILFVISDDQSFPHTSINGTAWVHTPGFDRIAKEGLLFNQAYTTNANVLLPDLQSWREETVGFWKRPPIMCLIFLKNSSPSPRSWKKKVTKRDSPEKVGHPVKRWKMVKKEIWLALSTTKLNWPPLESSSVILIISKILRCS